MLRSLDCWRNRGAFFCLYWSAWLISFATLCARLLLRTLCQQKTHCGDDLLEGSGHPLVRQGKIDIDTQSFPAKSIDHVQQPETTGRRRADLW